MIEFDFPQATLFNGGLFFSILFYFDTKEIFPFPALFFGGEPILEHLTDEPAWPGVNFK